MSNTRNSAAASVLAAKMRTVSAAFAAAAAVYIIIKRYQNDRISVTGKGTGPWIYKNGYFMTDSRICGERGR